VSRILQFTSGRGGGGRVIKRRGGGKTEAERFGHDKQNVVTTTYNREEAAGSKEREYVHN